MGQTIMSVLDSIISNADSIEIKIQYIALDASRYEGLADEIVSFSGIDLGDTKMTGIRSYKGIEIKEHGAGNVKVAYLF